MKLLKAQTKTGVLIKTIIILLIFNLIAPNFLIFRDMTPSLDLWLLLYISTEFIILGISFFIGLEIKRVNISILKKNVRAGYKASLVFLVISIVLVLLCLYLVENPYVGDNKFFIDRYIDHFCDAFFLSSLAFGTFAVFGTDRNFKYPDEHELKLKRKIRLKKALLYTSPITVILAVYLIYVYSYRMSVSDFSYIKAEDIESVKINYNDSRNETLYETQEEITEIIDIISQYSFETNVSTFIPNASYMSKRVMENETNKDSLLITVIYKDYDKQVEYLSFLQDGRLLITNLKDSIAYELSKGDAFKLFSDVYDMIDK